MFYSKETLYTEFQDATAKDTKGKKEKYDNRIQFFKDHIELRKNHPEYYDGVDINFTNLLEAWSAPNPRDHFYQKVFGKTFAEKQADDDFGVEGFSDEDKSAKTLEEKVEAMV